jgi:hypothetical protein
MNEKKYEFEINRYTYRLEGGGALLSIYARDKKTAEEIVSIVNTDTRFHWVPKRIGFCKKVFTSIPPYELEQQQIASAHKQLEYRRRNLKERQNEEIPH